MSREHEGAYLYEAAEKESRNLKEVPPDETGVQKLEKIRRGQEVLHGVLREVVVERGKAPSKESANAFDKSNARSEELMGDKEVVKELQTDAMAEDEYRSKPGVNWHLKEQFIASVKGTQSGDNTKRRYMDALRIKKEEAAKIEAAMKKVKES